MEYLDKYGFSDSEIEYLYNELDELDINELSMHEDRVCNIINYLKSIGIKNIKKLIIDRIELFYMSSSIIKKRFDDSDIPNIVELINEDFINFELLDL